MNRRSDPGGRGLPLWPLLCLLTPGSIMYTIVNPAMPALEAEFGAAPSASAWLVTAYLIASTGSTAIAGALMNRLGARRSLLVVSVLVAVGGAIAALAPSLSFAVAGRTLQGLSGAVLPIALGVVRSAVPASQAFGAFAIVSTWGAFGGGIGLLIGGPLVEALGPRAVFWAPSLATLVFVLLLGAVPRVQHPRTGGVDSAGIALGLISVTLLLVALSTLRSWPVLAAAGAAAGLALFAAWLRVERRCENPMIDVSALRGIVPTIVLMANFATGAVMVARLTTMGGFVELDGSAGGLGLSASAAGLILAPTSVGIAAVGILLRRPGTSAVDPRLVLSAGCAILAAGLAQFSIWHETAGLVAVSSLLNGVGIGAVFAATTPLIVGSTPLHATAGAVGSVTVVRALGASVGSQAAVALLSGSEPTPLGLTAHDHVLIAVVSAAAMSTIAVVAAVGVRWRRES